MNNQLLELHDLLFETLGLVHDKFLYKFRKESPNCPGLKKNHIRILCFLYKNQALTATEIARILNMEKGSLTTLIDQLEEFGLVVRCNDANDRRKTYVSLTDAGRAEMEDTIEYSVARLSAILADCNSADVQRFIDSLKYAVEFMQRL